MTIRPFTPDDYPALADLQRACHGDYASSEDELRYEDAHRPPEVRFRRLVAADGNGRVLGSGEYDQQVGRLHPRKFMVWVDVYPEYRNRGVGAALYDALTADLDRYDPIQFHVYVREGNEPGMRFAAQRGFAESRRIFPSDLDLAACDTSALPELEARLRDEGVTLQTIESLAGDPERDRKLHALCEAIRADFPSDDPPTPTPYEEWRKMSLENPLAVLPAYFVAVTRAGEYIGYNNVARDDEEPTRLWTKQTGVTRPYRRRGIATALKLRGAVWARGNGYATIRTTNDSANAGMLAVNTKMGFARQPAWVYLVKLIKEEE